MQVLTTLKDWAPILGKKLLLLRVYEFVVGKQPTVGAVMQINYIIRTAEQPARPIMSFNKFIRARGWFPTGRYIGAGRDKSGPTVGCLPTTISYTLLLPAD